THFSILSSQKYLGVVPRLKAGAQTSIYCATEEGIERLSGQYFVDCRPKVPSPQAHDDQLAKKLWEFSERLLGLTT
uniref:Short-chain dehydrogenase n=1 Tax=Naja naja TaxID=35670 RepID=A0A8C6VE10_NAJNA